MRMSGMTMTLMVSLTSSINQWPNQLLPAAFPTLIFVFVIWQNSLNSFALCCDRAKRRGEGKTTEGFSVLNESLMKPACLPVCLLSCVLRDELRARLVFQSVLQKWIAGRMCAHPTTSPFLLPFSFFLCAWDSVIIATDLWRRLRSLWNWKPVAIAVCLGSRLKFKVNKHASYSGVCCTVIYPLTSCCNA